MCREDKKHNSDKLEEMLEWFDNFCGFVAEEIC